MPRKGNVIQKVGSFLKRKPRVRYVLKIPKGVPIGNVLFTVQSRIEPVTFTSERDATTFKRLLRRSTHRIDSDIVRREVTDDGYVPTYGEHK